MTSTALALALVVGACDSETTTTEEDDATSSGGTMGAGGTGGMGTGGMLPFTVSSTAFAEGDTIPVDHECGPPAPVSGTGGNQTPPLTWTPGPPGTLSYAVVVRDIDATVPQFPDGIIHWVIYDIPATVAMLPQNVPPGYQVTTPAGAKQAEVQSTGFFGYFGPCSPNSINTYVFTVHAMNAAVLPGVTMASSEAEIAAIIESTSIASASLSGES